MWIARRRAFLLKAVAVIAMAGLVVEVAVPMFMVHRPKASLPSPPPSLSPFAGDANNGGGYDSNGGKSAAAAAAAAASGSESDGGGRGRGGDPSAKTDAPAAPPAKADAPAAPPASPAVPIPAAAGATDKKPPYAFGYGLERPAPAGQTCEVHRKIVYIKTHKTGSSTLANIFHRIAFKYKMLPVLPKGNLFLGWPVSARIPSSYVKLPQAKEGHYEIFCSAHTRYSRPLIEAIVPNAEYVTIVREPTSHFRSSWHYWGTAGHIMKNTGKVASMEDLIRDPDTWWPRANKGDRDLLNNNVAFDMGYTKDITRTQAQQLLEHMKTFALVMVTEYMDESLVLLRRQFCLDLDDVVYFSLKVTRKSKKPMEKWAADKIKELNWVDTMLYSHFNATLWKKIAAAPNFTEDLKAFRARKAELAQQCEHLSFHSEDQHRAALLGEKGPLPGHDRLCHLAQLDSGGFVKLLKKEWGMPDPECSTQGQARRQIVYIKTHKTGSSTLTNIFHRFVLNRRLRPMLPKNNLFLGWPHKSGLADSYVKLKPKSGKDVYDVLCSAHSRYNPGVTNRLIPGARYVTVLRNPVSHFASSWNYWHVSDHMRARHNLDIDMNAFLADPQKYEPMLTDSDRHLIYNSQSFDLGTTTRPTEDEVRQLLSTLMSFSMVLITEHMDESLVMMRRILCWEPKEILYLSLKVSTGGARKKRELPEEQANAIRKFNYADTLIYQEMNRTLWRKIGTEIGFKAEVEEFRSQKALWAAKCKPWLHESEDRHRKVLQENRDLEKDGDERACRLMLLDSSGFVKFLKRSRGVREPECHTQGRPRTNIQFVKTHKTGSSTLTNIFHRFGLKHRLKFALPLDNLFFGWPSMSPSAVTRSIDTYKPGPYNLFVSAHSMYHAKEFNQLVPDPMTQRVTIIRNPVTHFRSSWLHWHVADHIKAKGGGDVTMEQFLDAPDKYWKQATWSDPLLLHNSMSFDMGLGEHPKPADVDNLISTMQQRFLILVTDYMDESLVLMRRIFCWKPEDIVYLSLKVSGSHKKMPALSGATAEKIRKLNWADQRIYNAMNRTLWSRISYEINFQEEVAAFREARARQQEVCKHLVPRAADEEWHRLNLEEKKLSPAMRSCHLMLLDSKGFVKHIKKLTGSTQRECRTATMKVEKNLVLIRPRFGNTELFGRVAHRFAAVHGLVAAVPADMAASVEWGARMRVGRAGRVGSGRASVAAAGFMPYDKARWSNLVSPGAWFLGAVSDPVETFLQTWTALDVAKRLAGPDGKPMSIKEFLLAPKEALDRLGDDAVWLNNAQSRSFGLSQYISLESSSSAIKNSVTRRLRDEFAVVMVAENPVDSLIMTRRQLCWNYDDIVHLAANTEKISSSISASSLTQPLRAGVRAFNWLDSVIYDVAVGILSTKLDAEVALKDERKIVAGLLAKAERECADARKLPDSAHAKRVPAGRCNSLAMSDAGWINLIANGP